MLDTQFVAWLSLQVRRRDRRVAHNHDLDCSSQSPATSYPHISSHIVAWYNMCNMSTQKDAPSVLEAEKDKDGNLVPKYSEAEKHYNKTMQTLLTRMQQEREQKRPQFDDMSYDQYDDRAIKADISYIPPAKNKGDTRIVTGMTREKDSTLLSTTLSYDFEPNFSAYDLQDRIIDEIGENLEDLVFKSRQIEEYSSKRPLLYRGIIARGTYYAMELYVERWGYEKELPKNYLKGQVTGIDWSERLSKVYEGCEVNGLDPKKVYLGSMTEFFLQNQDVVAIIERVSYASAYETFNTWERWKNVPTTFTSSGATSNSGATASVWNPYWSVTDIKEGEVEKITIMKKKTNELQIMLNGVMMLPVVLLGFNAKQEPIVSGFPLTCISPSGDYPMAKGDYEPVDGFAISKGQPAKMRVDQEVLDEFLKLMIMKTKQSFWPAMANNSGRVLTRQNFLPAVINDDIKKGSVYPLIEGNGGVTSGEFSFYQLIKGMMEDKSVTAQYDGQDTKDMTATQVLENKKQQLMKLGLALDGIVRFERDIAMLRLRNLLVHWTKSQDTQIDAIRGGVRDVYRTVTIEKSKYGRRQRSRKIIKFTKDTAAISKSDPRGYNIHSAEEKAKRKTGVDTNYVFIDPEILRNLKATWYCTIVPSDKKDDTLSRMIFIQNVREAIEIFGPESMNVEKLKQRYSAVIGEDYDTWFKDEGTLEQMMAGAPVQGAPGAKGGQPYKAPNTKPSMKMAIGMGA